ncbi:hypothetical protein ACN28S_32245 [Cystobacter fuscus]
MSHASFPVHSLESQSNSSRYPRATGEGSFSSSNDSPQAQQQLKR